jgi:hypothetical protein
MTHFVIFKLDKRLSKWSKVTSIGDDAIFIGKNNLLSIPSQNLRTDWRKNYIYFLDAYTKGHIDGLVGCYDNVRYNLENGRIELMLGYLISDSLLVSQHQFGLFLAHLLKEIKTYFIFFLTMMEIQCHPFAFWLRSLRSKLYLSI